MITICRSTRRLSKFLAGLFTGLAMVCATGAQAQTQIGESSGRLEWSGWTLDYDTFIDNDGLSLLDVTYNGVQILGRASFPVMTVYYQNNQCGPYADRLNGPQATVGWAGNAKLVARSFTQNGKQWFELGIREFIGAYDIYQVWYLSEDGQLDGHVFSRGLQCNVFHEHYPMWRLDFDIDGPANDRIVRQTGVGQFSTYSTEFETAANDAFEHGWYVQDKLSGYQVRVDFDDGAWNVSGAVTPETAYAQNLVGAMRARSSETGWPGAASQSFPHDNGESIDGTDLVMWYRGYLPHSPEEGTALWHSTGIRISTDDPDTDGDGINDSADLDDDNDGVPDEQDDLPRDPTETVDTDGDGLGNNADTDDDNDQVTDALDAFPLNGSESRDTDGDGTGDNADIDADNDGITDIIESGDIAFDFDIPTSNVGQSGATQTQTIDLSSRDTAIGQTISVGNLVASGDLNSASETISVNFNDGEYLATDLNTGVQCSGSLDPVIQPFDALVSVIDIGGGTPGIRVTVGTSTNVDNQTNCIGVNYRFHINGLPFGTDQDGDGVPNMLDLDSDNDGLLDVSEAGGTDSDADGIINNASANQGSLTTPLDSDNDGSHNYLDRESNNAANDGSSFDIAGTRYASLDTNSDGTINASDANGGTDTNNNGIDDAIETLAAGPDFDNDGIVDELDPDDDNDGVNDGQDAFPLNPSESIDTDNDGTRNNADTDDDNDGTPDNSDPNPLDPTITGNSGEVDCNRFSNGAFEGSVTGWFTDTTLINTTDAHSGTGAVSLSDGWIGFVEESTAGTLYTFSGFYKTPATGSWTGFGVDFVDANGQEVGELVRTLEPTDNWLAFTLDAQIPAGASYIRPWIYAQAGRTVIADDLDLRKTGCSDNTGEVNQSPFVSNPGNQLGNVGDSVSLSVSASDPESQAISFAAGGLPDGLTINSSTGQITGTLLEEGTRDVAISVSDGGSVGMATFVWTVTQPGNTAQCNTLPNAGFENGAGSWNSNTSATISTQANTGNAALSFAGGWVSLTMPASAGSNYTFSGQYKAGAGTGWIGHGVDYLDAAGNEIGDEVRTLGESTQYTGFSISSQAPTGTTSLRLWFFSEVNRTITLDDLDLRETGCTRGNTDSACNQVINPDFELSDGGWFTNTTPNLTADAATGAQAIQITDGWLSTANAARGGVSYTGSAMIRAQGSSGYSGMGMDFVSGRGVKLGEAVVGIDNMATYGQISLTGIAPEGTTGIQLWIYADSGRVINLDDVDLRVTGCQ